MSDIEDLVREGLDRLTEGANAPPGIAARVIRHRRRQRATVRATMVSGVAAVAAVAVLLATGTGGSGTSGSATQMQTTAYVLSHVAKALSAPNVNSMILEVSAPAQVEKPPHGPSFVIPGAITWTYRQQSRSEMKGLHGSVTTIEGGNANTETIVQPTSSIWTWVRTITQNLPDPGLARNGCTQTNTGQYDSIGFSLPWWLRATVNCGGLAVAGDVRIDGQNTIKLITTRRMAGPLDGIMYVSPRTYLPVRITTLGVLGSTSDWRWLPATPTNLAELVIQIPAGFRYVPPSKWKPYAIPDPTVIRNETTPGARPK
jgi:hypothetical protein